MTTASFFYKLNYWLTNIHDVTKRKENQTINYFHEDLEKLMFPRLVEGCSKFYGTGSFITV